MATKTTKKAILFDFGGTLDTNGIHWSEVFWDIYCQYNINVSKKDFEAAYINANKTLTEHGVLINAELFLTILSQLQYQFFYLSETINDFTISGTKVMEIADYLFGKVSDNLIKNQKLLLNLKENYKLGLVSNFDGNLLIICKEFGYNKIFDIIIDSFKVDIRKPDPDIFRLALERLDVKPEEAIMIGDNYNIDILPAKNMLMTTIWLKGKSWYQPDNMDCADFKISSLDDIDLVIDKIND